MSAAARVSLGRLPNDPAKPRLRLEDYQAAAPTPPASADWISGVRSWGVLANDQAGDCTCAGAGHVAMAVSHFGQGHDIAITDQDALTMYEALSGYDPATGANDNGATLQDALGYWSKTGIAGHKIVAYAQVKATDLATVRACIAEFGAVYTGMWFPASAMDQFNAGQPWTVAPRAKIEGGHCVPIGAYDATSFTCVTWGRAQKMDLAFYRRYFDEVWVPIDLAWLSAAGVSPAGLDTAALNAGYQALTGRPGPFPASPAPAPAPAPAPSPRPAVDPVDAAFADAAGLFVHALSAWETAKGLA